MSIFNCQNKDEKKVSIRYINKIKILSKRAIRAITKLIQMSKNNNKKYKATAISKNKYFNYYKIRYFKQNYRIFNYKLFKKKNTSNTKKI